MINFLFDEKSMANYQSHSKMVNDFNFDKEFHYKN